FERNAKSRDEMDQVEAQLKVAEQTARVREEQLNQLLRGTRPEDIQQAKAQLEEARQAFLLEQNGSRTEDIAEAKASLEAADAAVHVIEAQVKELLITAPVQGTIEALELRPGDVVGPNAPVLSMIDTSHIWVRAYVPENHL